MESLSHIVCVRCYSAVGKDHEVLLCSTCNLWQHRTCSKGVSEKYYLEFYLATVLGEKPMPWTCHYCSQYQPMVKVEQLSPEKTEATTATEKNPKSSLLLPPNPPPSLISDDNSGYDSDSSSFDELTLNYESQRNGREGPTSYTDTHRTCSDNQIAPVSNSNKVIINSQPIFSDTSRDPTLYTLTQTSNDQKEVYDNLGNVFILTEVITDAVTLYQCATADCGFKVRVCETINEFLSAGSQSSEQHNHNSASIISNPASVYNASDNNIFSTDTDEESSGSSIIPEITPTPFHTPARRKCASTRFSNSYCTDTTDDEDPNPVPFSTSIQRFTALTCQTPCVPLNVSFSCDSNSDDDCETSVLCDLLSSCSDEEITCTPPSPASTIPAMESSESSEDESDTIFQVTTGTTNGERALLTDSHGHTYNIKFILEARTFWCCTEKSRRCPASVIQSRRDHFTMGVASHNHSSIQPKVHFPYLTPSSPQPNWEPGTITPIPSSTITAEPEPGTTTPSQSACYNPEPEPESDISVTEPTETTVFHEIEACLPRQKKSGSLIVSSDGFIFHTKVEDQSENKTYWHCTHSTNGTKCEASLVFNDKQPFSHGCDRNQTWLVNRRNGRYTDNHNHSADYRAVVMAKVRMMIRRRIFLYGVLEEAPNTLISNIFEGLDYKGHTYLDSTGNPVLTADDKDYLPSTPLQMQVLKRVVKRQKDLYRDGK